MDSSSASPNDPIVQLDKARKLALADPSNYPTLVNGILPVIGPTAPLNLRRWGADFLAETFANPTFAVKSKEQLSLHVLQALKEYLEIPGEDAAVVKSSVQAATSIYPLLFRYVVYNTPTANVAWQNMSAIKSNILRRMDTTPAGVKLCCIKFIQRVVLVQTPGLIADPRRPDQNDISSTLVPRDHPVLSPPNLEAEAFGLLDRLLGVFQETMSNALLVTATINCLGILIRTRASIAHKIIMAILNFNPFSIVRGNLNPQVKVMVKSMERTIRVFLVNLNKRNPGAPLAGRIQGYVDRLVQSRDEIFNNNRKRPAAIDDTMDPSKRQRLGIDQSITPEQFVVPPLPPGPVTMAQVFTLTTDEGLRSFDVNGIPVDLLSRILVPIISKIDAAQLTNAVNAVNTRLKNIAQAQTASAAAAAKQAVGFDDDEEEYEPGEDIEQTLNRLDQDNAIIEAPEVSLGPYIIPQPPALTTDEAAEYCNSAIVRVFEYITQADKSSDTRAKSREKPGFNRLAATNHDRDSWATIAIRLATRALSGLESFTTKAEGSQDSVSRSGKSAQDIIRESLFNYVKSDFRERIEVAISWLTEEWYNDRLQEKANVHPILHYEELMLKMLDYLLLYVSAKDTVLIRFLSEVPSVNAEAVNRVKKTAKDNELVPLVIKTLHYLAAFRPPVRSICVDELEDLWRNYPDAKGPSSKLLKRYRPEVLEQEAVKEDVKSPSASTPVATAA